VTDPRLKTTLGEYTLLEKIGQGAMGEVYEAIQDSLQRKVALKVLSNRLVEDKEQVERFAREAQAAASLHHPHIVPVYGFGTQEGTPYFAMELVRGRSLKDLIHDKKAPLTDPRKLAKYALQVAEALDYAHRAGVVHRDVKPANILIKDEDDKAVVADFGLARQMAARSITREGMLLGTPMYMAPEQALGDEIDGRIDVWALGVTLYEGLTLGKLPFDSNDLREVIIMITSIAPPPIRRIRKEAPWELEAIALKCLAKNREERYQSARELADDLIRYLRGDVIYAAPTPAAARLAKKIKKHKGATALAVALVLVVGLGTTALLLESGRKLRQQVKDALKDASDLEAHGFLDPALDKTAVALLLDPTSVEAALVHGRLQAEIAARGQVRSRELERTERAAKAAVSLAEAERIAGPTLDEWRRRSLVLARKIGFRSETVLGGDDARLAAASRAVTEERAAVADLEDTLADASGEVLSRLDAARTEAPPGDPVDDRARAFAADLRRALVRWAERHGETRLAQGYLRDLAPQGLAPVGSSVLSIKTMPQGAKARLSWITWDGKKRQESAPTALGVTPEDVRSMPVSSTCILELELEGHVPCRLSLLVSERERTVVAVRLIPQEDVPPGFVYVPAGEHFPARDPLAVRARALTDPVWVDGYFLGKDEVTLGEYLDYVNDAAPTDRLARLPAKELVRLGAAPDGQAIWVPGEARAGEDARRYPAAGVSFENARDFAAWKTRRGGGAIVYRLPTEDEWEKAARGVEALGFPWGDALSGEKPEANLGGAFDRVFPVGSFPLDRSVSGCEDMAGNVAEWTSDLFQKDIHVVRGGSFARTSEVVRLAAREPVDSRQFQASGERYGFRLAFHAPPKKE
jgi:formylglycine-generating enzyme required for sulfatase activity/tRNA A-37 threonylcarbamoyl transferase component Bud32